MNEAKVHDKVMQLLKSEVIEVAPETSINAFPLLCVPKKGADGLKVDIPT